MDASGPCPSHDTGHVSVNTAMHFLGAHWTSVSDTKEGTNHLADQAVGIQQLALHGLVGQRAGVVPS